MFFFKGNKFLIKDIDIVSLIAQQQLGLMANG